MFTRPDDGHEAKAFYIREAKANAARDDIYHAVLSRLGQRQITGPEAVAALRAAYRRADRELRGLPV